MAIDWYAHLERNKLQQGQTDMAFRNGNSNSRYGKNDKNHGGYNKGGSKGKGNYGKKNQKKEYPAGSAFINLFEYDPTESENYDRSKNYPSHTGYINVTPEAIKEWLKLPVNPEYGTVSLRVSIWEDRREGKATGTVQLPIVSDEEVDEEDEEDDEDEEEVEEEPVAKVAAKKPAAAKATAKKTSTKKTAAVEPLGEDIPF